MKTFKDISKKNTDLEEACWVGYKKVGMKKKGDRMVPNCVKEEVVNEVYGKDWTYDESVADMYKGKLSDTQLTNLKNLWKTKKQSDVTPSVKSYVRGLDQFTKMDIKQANIKYLSNLVDEKQHDEEVDFISPLQDQIEIIEMNSVVRKTDIKEAYFSKDQIERLAKAYSVMKDRTISPENAKRLSKMMDGVPPSSLNDIRKKKIPFLSGLAMNKMIQLKMPIKEDLDKEEVKESVDDIRKNPNWKLQPGGGMYPKYKHPKHGNINIDRYGGWQHAVNGKVVAFFSPSYPDNKFSNTGATSMDLSDYMKLKKINEDLDKDDKKTIEPIIKQLQKSVTAHGKQAKQLKKDIKDEKDLEEADLSKSQITKVHKQADDLPKKDFMKRYGKDGDAVRYATATNMVKKKLGIGEDNKLINKGELKMNESYKLKLNSAMEHYKIASLAELKDEDQKAFFSYVDGLKEGLTAGQKKLPAGLQKAILAKQGKKDDSKDEMHDMKKDDKKDVKEEDAYDKDDPKQKPKKEMMAGNMNAMKKPMNAMMKNAMKMPIRKTEDLVGGQKKLDKDKDGDLDAKDFAMLRKTKSEAVKTGEADAEPKVKELNAMVKNPMNAMKDPMNAMKDMNATYMKSNVKASVMNNGGADMAKVKDAPAMNDPMKKINATYGAAKEVMDIAADKNKMMKKEGLERAYKYLETKPGSLEEAVLKTRGLIK